MIGNWSEPGFGLDDEKSLLVCDAIEEFADDLHATLLATFLDTKVHPGRNVNGDVSGISLFLLAQLQFVILLQIK